MLKSKKIICFIVCLLVFMVVVVFIDQKTTYMVAVNQNNVEVSNENIVIEMSSGTSAGYFKKAELEEIDDGVYSIKAFFVVIRRIFWISIHN